MRNLFALEVKDETHFLLRHVTLSFELNLLEKF